MGGDGTDIYRETVTTVRRRLAALPESSPLRAAVSTSGLGEAARQIGRRLRRDRFIRDRLRHGSPPWRVEELRAADLGQGGALVARLKEV